MIVINGQLYFPAKKFKIFPEFWDYAKGGLFFGNFVQTDSNLGANLIL